MNKQTIKDMIFKQKFLVTEDATQTNTKQENNLLSELRSNPMFLVNYKHKQIIPVEEALLLDTLTELRHELTVTSFSNDIYVYEVQRFNNDATVDE